MWSKPKTQKTRTRKGKTLQQHKDSIHHEPHPDAAPEIENPDLVSDENGYAQALDDLTKARQDGKIRRMLLTSILEKAEKKAKLTDRQQECYNLFYKQQKDLREIGALLHINFSAVSRHLEAAVKKIKLIAQADSQQLGI